MGSRGRKQISAGQDGLTVVPVPTLPGTRHPEGAGHAAAAEDADGADPVPIHLRLPSPHSVPEKLQAHLSSCGEPSDCLTPDFLLHPHWLHV